MNKTLPFTTALVTGASSGIGQAFARELALRGVKRLILLARNGQKLEALKHELQEKYSIEIQCFSIDLSHPPALKALLTDIETLAWPIDCLINNAGFTIRTEDECQQSDVVQQMIQLMAATPVLLCQRIGSKMLEKKTGYILNVSSIVGCFPVATTLSYCAIKRFLTAYSHSLSYEWRSEGIRVSCLQPGATMSSFHESNQLDLPDKLKSIFRSSEQVARIGLNGLIRGKRDIFPGFENYLLFLITRIIPHRWIYILHKNWWRKRRKQWCN
jgi:uncharacterized protein